MPVESIQNKRTEIEELTKDLLFGSFKFCEIFLKPTRGWSDSVEHFTQAFNIQDKSYYIPPNTRSRDDHVHRRLGHIVVSLKDFYNTEALKKCYVYMSDDNVIDEKIVNRNKESMENFVEKLITSANAKASNIFSRKNVADDGGRKAALKRDSLYIIHGKRGIGKTFFLNHVLSTFSDRFDKEKVLWIRINLLNDFGDNSNIKHWLYAQLTKVIFRFYDPASPFYSKKDVGLDVDAVNLLTKFAEKQDEDVKLFYKQQIVGMKQVFHSEHSIEPISPLLINEQLARQLYLELIKFGYKFIFVLDGYDRIEALAHAEHKFDKIRDALTALVGNNDNSGFVILIVTRQNGITKFSNDGHGSIRIKNQNVKQLGDVNIERIVEKRLDYVRTEVLDIVTTPNNSSFKWDCADWESHYTKFYNEILGNSNRPEQQTRYIDFLNQLYGHNRRAQMQSLQLKYFEFLKNETKLSYRLVESLVCAGRRLPPRSYFYQMSASGLERSSSSSIFDNHFLPNIFCFPFDSETERNERVLYPSDSMMLMGIRLLQLVKVQDEIIEEEKSFESLKSEELAVICQTIFNYPKKLVFKLIEEFGEFEFFMIGGINLGAARQTRDYQPKSMPKLLYILDHMLTDAAYLNLCSMRVPLNIDAFREYEQVIIKAEPYPCADLKKWLTKLLINNIIFLHLIQHQNSKESDLYQLNIKKLKAKKRLIKVAEKAEQAGMFDISKIMIGNVFSQLKKIIYTSNVDILEHIYANLEKFHSNVRK